MKNYDKNMEVLREVHKRITNEDTVTNEEIIELFQNFLDVRISSD